MQQKIEFTWYCCLRLFGSSLSATGPVASCTVLQVLSAFWSKQVVKRY